jgi:type IV secretory pathway TrbF-like protein
MFKKFLGNLTTFYNEQLHLDSTSVIMNSGLVNDDILRAYGHYMDTVAVSCDSYYEQTKPSAMAAEQSQETFQNCRSVSKVQHQIRAEDCRLPPKL